MLQLFTGRCKIMKKIIKKEVVWTGYKWALVNKESDEEYQARIDEEETWDRLTEGGYGSG